MRDANRLLEARGLLGRACEDHGAAQRRMVLVALRHLIAWRAENPDGCGEAEETDHEAEASRAG